MKIRIHSKNIKEKLDRVQIEFEKMIEMLKGKYQFMHHENNQVNVSIEVNKDLTFLAKITFNLVNLGEQIITTDSEQNLFKLLNNCKKKLEKQLEKLKNRWDEKPEKNYN